MDTLIITLRKTPQVTYDEEYGKSTLYPPGAVTIAYKVLQPDPDLPATVLLGLMFTSPQGNFNRKLANKVALGRLQVNPLKLVLGTPQAVTRPVVVFLVRSFLLAKTEWVLTTDFHPVKRMPVWSSEFIGPEGAVVSLAAGVPGNPSVPHLVDLSVLDKRFARTRGWVFLSIPRWAQDFVKELD